MERLDDLLRRGHGLVNMDTGEPLETVLDSVQSANAYLGAEPIVNALGQGPMSSLRVALPTPASRWAR